MEDDVRRERVDHRVEVFPFDGEAKGMGWHGRLLSRKSESSQHRDPAFMTRRRVAGGTLGSLGMQLSGRASRRRTGAAAAAVALCAISAGSALASAPKPGARYVGSTSQERTLTIHVSRSGERTTSRSIVVADLKCPNGRTTFATFRPAGARIADGRFRFRGSQTIGPYRFVATVTGEFSNRGRRLEGTLVLRRVSPTGTICRSGRVTYTARAKRR
jgi:hypothetical protein